MVRDRVHAELVVVDSRDAAVAAVNAKVPDVILLTALLSPRDEAEIIAHLRTVEGAEHVQTHTIPQLASSADDGDAPVAQGGLLGKLRRKKVAEPIPGCDPSAFADEVGVFITRAAEMKVITSSPATPTGPSAKRSKKATAAAATAAAGATTDEPAAAADAESAWSSPLSGAGQTRLVSAAIRRNRHVSRSSRQRRWQSWPKKKSSAAPAKRQTRVKRGAGARAAGSGGDCEAGAGTDRGRSGSEAGT